MYETWKYYIHFLALGFSFLDTFWKEKSIRQFLHVSFLSHFKNSNRTNRQEQSMFVLAKAEKRLTFWLPKKPAGEADCLLMVREGKQELILAIIPQSLSSPSHTPPCLPPSSLDCEA